MNVVILGLSLVFLLSIGIFEITSTAFADAEIKGHSATLALDRSTYTIPTTTGDLKVSIIITDNDFNKSPNGIDQSAESVSGEPGVGPVKISVNRGNKVILGYGGGPSANSGPLDSTPIEESTAQKSQIKQFGPITETSPTSGVFKFDIIIKKS